MKDKNIEEMLSPIFTCTRDTVKSVVKDILIPDIERLVNDAKQQGRDEVLQNVGYLRQWLNEDRITDNNKLVENKDILYWLKIKNS